MINYCLDLMKISQALENTYYIFKNEHSAEMEGIKRLELAKDEWKQAITYALSSSIK